MDIYLPAKVMVKDYSVTGYIHCTSYLSLLDKWPVLETHSHTFYEVSTCFMLFTYTTSNIPLYPSTLL